MAPTISIVLLLQTLSYATTSDILGIFPYQGKSHFIVFKVYLRELANRGHNVTVISQFPEDHPPANYHDISIAGTSVEIEDTGLVHRSYKTIMATGLYLATTGRDNCEVMLANKEVQGLVNKKTKFDLVIVEQFNSDCALGIAYKLKAPVVGVTSHILMPWHYNRFGIAYNPSYVSFHFLEGGTKPTFYQRVERVTFDFIFKTLYYFISQRNNQNTLAKYFDDIPPLEQLAREIKFLLLYQNFILSGSQLYPANVIEVGGYHVTAAKPLAGDLKEFVDGAVNGIIYISFGSVIRSTSLSPEKRNAILGAMAEFPQRFIWKWEDKTMMFDKNKVYVSSWLPQVDILGHTKTVGYLSHAGMGGTTEAIYYGVPIIAIPILGDQPSNAAAIEESGLGVNLALTDLNKENLVTAIRKILDPKFKENAKRISKAWHDRPLSPMDTAIYWTEFAARYPNFKYTAAAADVPLYQYFCLDVIFVFTVIIVLVLGTLKAIFTLFCVTKKKQVKSIKSKQK